MVKIGFKIVLIAIVSSIFLQMGYAQDNTVYDEMSLDEICDVNVVVSASKKPEDLFEAPLSVTIIKKAEIQKAGCRSIMEALRLAPGLLVRETTPGNFDVHIRGFDDINKNFYVPLPFNSTILVMIDYRVVFSYFSGGTLWETLPIGIQDIERIEVVRGPASALYGPNAVNGVINIITSQAKDVGLNTYLHGSIGSQNSKIANASVGYNWDDKTKISFSGNTTERYRFDDDLYSWAESRYMPVQDMSLIMNLMKDSVNRNNWVYKDFTDTLRSRFDPDLSYRTVSGNIYFLHNIGAESKIDFSIGAHHSESQKPGPMNFITPMSQNTSKSIYFDSHLKFGDWSGQINIINGEDLNNFAFNSYKYSVLNYAIEYNWQIFKSLNLRLGYNNRQVEYYSPIINDEPFDFAKMNYKFGNKSRNVGNDALFFLAEWKLSEKLRVIYGQRSDNFSLNLAKTENYEFAATYRIDKDNLLRFVNSQSNRSPFIFDTYLNSKNEYDEVVPTLDNKPLTVHTKQLFVTTKDLKYPTNNTIEMGWRSKISDNVELDFEVFRANLTNLLVSLSRVKQEVKVRLNPEFMVDSVMSVRRTEALSTENLNMSALQNGLTFSAKIQASEKLNFNLYGTLQFTEYSGASNYEVVSRDSSYSFDSINYVLTETFEIVTNISDWNSKSTPNFYGGLTINYKPVKKWNINLNTYFYSKQSFLNTNVGHSSDDIEMKINPWANINLKVSYNPLIKLTLYASGSNLLGRHREFWGTDNIDRSFFFGLQWGF